MNIYNKESETIMKKILCIDEPILKCRLHIAYPMISFMQHSQGNIFLNNFFINLECHKYNKDINLSYVSQLDHEDLSWIHYLNDYFCYLDFLKEKNMDFDMAIQDELKKQKYIYITFDDYYLPYKMEKPHHYNHVNLIFGYNLAEKVYYTIGYDNHHNFRTIVLPFDAARKGFSSPVVEVFKPNFKKKFEFSKKHFLVQINDFLNSENNLISAKALKLDEINKHDYLYGIQIYDRVYEQLNLIKFDGYYDVRILYLLREWTKLNLERINFLNQHGYFCLPDQISTLAVEANNIIEASYFCSLKYRNNKNYREIEKSIDLLKRHQDKVYLLYSKLRKIILNS